MWWPLELFVTSGLTFLYMFFILIIVLLRNAVIGQKLVYSPKPKYNTDIECEVGCGNCNMAVCLLHIDINYSNYISSVGEL